MSFDVKMAIFVTYWKDCRTLGVSNSYTSCY